VDYRLYDKATDQLSKNDHFRHLLTATAPRGFQPRCVLFDSWYASLETLKHVREQGWAWLTRLKSNRQVRLGGGPLRPLSACALAAEGQLVWLKGYGPIRVFRLAVPDGGTDGAHYWASSEGELS
jgi:hypothetical protein